MFVKPPNLGTGNIVFSTNEMLTKEGSKVKVMMITTNEELVIAKDTLALVK